MSVTIWRGDGIDETSHICAKSLSPARCRQRVQLCGNAESWNSRAIVWVGGIEPFLWPLVPGSSVFGWRRLSFASMDGVWRGADGEMRGDLQALLDAIVRAEWGLLMFMAHSVDGGYLLSCDRTFFETFLAELRHPHVSVRTSSAAARVIYRN